MLFDSRSDPIPRLREDLEVIPTTDDGKDVFVLRDPSGYSSEMIVLRPEAWALLSLFSGTKSVDDLVSEIQKAVNAEIDGGQILEIAKALDKYLFLDNKRFHKIRLQQDEAYRQETVRRAAHAGASYPEDAEELTGFFRELFEADSFEPLQGELLGVIAPHIDLQIGAEVYVPAFKQLQAAEFDSIVILGTSHYSSEDLFLMTDKDFETPLGVISTDREFVSCLRDNSDGVFTQRDVAHRQEHSIEFPVLFLQHLFGNTGKKIIPILCSSFEHFMLEDADAEIEDRYTAFLRAFRNTVQQTGRRVIFVLSVDWSHVGRKFGDDEDAAEILSVVQEADHLHFEALEACDYNRFRELLKESDNNSKIDGFSCITAFFDLQVPDTGKLLDYRQWHEVERQSAVSFASMAFFRNTSESGTV